jgi:Ca2+/Na+ antiporter
MTTFLLGLFIMAASCYLLFITSEPLERVGGRLGRLLHLPEDVIASTFQALATSGPEIVMAILAATAFIAMNSAWEVLTVGERGCAGCLNMSFSAMDNLLGIGCVAMIFMMWRKKRDRKGNLLRNARGEYQYAVTGKDPVVVAPTVKAGLIFYIFSSGALCVFLQTSSHIKILDDGREIVAHTMFVWQAWVLMAIGITFVVSQFFLPPILARIHAQRVAAGLEPELADDADDEDDEDRPIPRNPFWWFLDLLRNGFIYAFLVFALIVFVRECMSATFNMATVGIVSVGGILIIFTSYVSSFPEFMMTYRYAVADKKSALLGMLFGSNVIDLAFAGFRAIRLGEPMEVYTTGWFQISFPFYLWCLPALALLTLLALAKRWFKYWHAYPLVVFYVIYIVSGALLL